MPTDFRAVKDLDVNEVQRLLEDGEYKEAVDVKVGMAAVHYSPSHC